MLKNDTIVIRVSDDLKKEIQRLAIKDKRKMSDYIRVTMEKQVELLSNQ